MIAIGEVILITTDTLRPPRPEVRID